MNVCLNERKLCRVCACRIYVCECVGRNALINFPLPCCAANECVSEGLHPCVSILVARGNRSIGKYLGRLGILCFKLLTLLWRKRQHTTVGSKV